VKRYAARAGALGVPFLPVCAGWNDDVMQARFTDITGLTSTTVFYFRFRGVTKAGEGAYSQIVQILVPSRRRREAR
jgi:hypothetical protein